MPHTSDVSPLYEKDFYLWLEKTAQALKNRQFEVLDLENLVEEIETMGRSEKREALSRLTTIIEHLLKLIYWESERPNNERGWLGTVTTQRIELMKVLNDSPSLRNYLAESYSKCLKDAIAIFEDKTGIKVNEKEVDFTVGDVLDSNWRP